MFTGLIETVGEVAASQAAATGQRIRIRSALAAEMSIGDSVAVNGVCLTLVESTGDHFAADIGPETARVTTLGALRAGDAVNLERSMRADARFGGHFVLGHVDGSGAVAGIRADGEAHWLTISLADSLAPYVIPKGSIAVDGISLTVAALRERAFDVMIVPHTWMHTNLRERRSGDLVNLECDVIGKYVVRAAGLWPIQQER